jgi:cytochrome c-type biogenesis protein CcmF
LYIVLGEGDLKKGWVVKIYHNPLVMWIWLGALTIFIGGIISININLKKIK